MILDKYELLEMIGADDERKSFKARDTSSSRNVIVHALTSQSTSTVKPDLVELAKSLFRSGSVSELLFAGEYEGTFYVVSEGRDECQDVRKWLEQQSAAKSGRNPSNDAFGKAGLWKVPTVSETPAPSSSNPGEFTQMFQSAPTGAEHQAKAQSEGKLSGVDGPGEFTQRFSTELDPPAVAPGLPSPPVAAKTPPAVAPTPSEFTKMFQAAGPSQPISAADQNPGQFTRLFQTPSPPERPAVEYVKVNSESAPAATAKPGEFTGLFASAPDAQKNAGTLPYEVMPPASRVPANALPLDNPPFAAPQNSGMAGGPQTNNQGATGVFRTRSVAQPPMEVLQPAGPSEFTQVIAVPAPRPEPAPVPAASFPTPNTAPPSSPSAPAITPNAPITPSYLPLILILNGLFVLAILLIVYFALKK